MREELRQEPHWQRKPSRREAGPEGEFLAQIRELVCVSFHAILASVEASYGDFFEYCNTLTRSIPIDRQQRAIDQLQCGTESLVHIVDRPLFLPILKL
jgi:hypothetical protein